MKKVSLHIAVDEVDQRLYAERFDPLPGCNADARAMAHLASCEGLLPSTLRGSEATADAVLAALRRIAQELDRGDFLFVTFSGHGSVVPDGNRDEEDRYDETLVLHDRQLLDDELWAAWAQFRAGVRIFVVIDSCHSGTAARMLDAVADRPVDAPATLAAPVDPLKRSRRLPRRARASDFAARAALYRQIDKATPPPDSVDVAASVLLFAACQDVEDAQEDDTGGVFTRALLEVWHSGSAAGYIELFDAAARLVAGQTPNYLPLGVEDASFERSRPLSG